MSRIKKGRTCIPADRKVRAIPCGRGEERCKENSRQFMVDKITSNTELSTAVTQIDDKPLSHEQKRL